MSKNVSRSVKFLSVMVTSLAALSAAEAKTPGHEYCFHNTCHRVKSLDETRRLIGVPTNLKASFYDDAGHDRYNPSNETSSGEHFRSDRPDNAASPIYPDGTKLLVWHPASKKALVIRVNNAGPYWGDRKLDLSRAAAEKFGFTGSGVTKVQVKVLEAPSQAEATYKRGRHYPAVSGYIGQFASLDAAVDSSGSTTRLASVIAPKVSAPNKLTVLVDKATLAPKPVADKLQVMPAPQPTTLPNLNVASIAKPTQSLTLLDLRLARFVNAEARKFLVAQNTRGVTSVLR